MIDELVVKNLGIIEFARLEPGPGLTVITGETGTGKTLLLGALRLLLGGDSRPDLIGPFSEEAVVEGRFLRADGSEVGASRRLPRDGRSRAYLDGSVASARALEDSVAGLVDVVAQHDHLALTRPAEARAMVDRCLPDGGVLARYRRAWDGLQEVLKAREHLGGDRQALVRELELVTYQSNEIAATGLSTGDDASLQDRADRLRHADEIAGLLGGAGTLIDRARDDLGEAVASLRKAARLAGGLDHLAQVASDLADAIGDLAHDVVGTSDDMERDPEALAELDARLTQLGELRRKYGRTLEDILAYGAQASRRRTELESLLEKAEVIDEEVAAAEVAVEAAAAELTRERERAGTDLAAAAGDHLRDLGFSDPVVSVSIEPAPASANGADAVTVLFASDSRLTPGPVATVASGGELSRLVLALRLAGGGDAASLVFDEIDAGVGGATALALGRKLAALAGDHQVLCVTHLPQIAAFADSHYVVQRQDTTATVTHVADQERVTELTRMLAGLPESERGREAAAELLVLASS